MDFQRTVESYLNKVAGMVFPATLTLVFGTILMMQVFVNTDIDSPNLPLRAALTAADADIFSQEVLTGLDQTQLQKTVPSDMEKGSFLIAIDVPGGNSPERVFELPSRHATAVRCWDRETKEYIGEGVRQAVKGKVYQADAGFAFNISKEPARILCEANFRGPAKITAKVWETDDFKTKSKAHFRSGVLLEAGIGILALSMLLNAVVNRSLLYFVFVGWLLLSMRMAALSSGTDFTLFTQELPVNLLLEVRKWTITMYFAMTIALFGMLFKDEISALKHRFALGMVQLAALVISVACIFATFEQIVVTLWVATPTGVAVMLYYLSRVIIGHRSRMSLWYAASITVTLLASLNEVVSAAIGPIVFLQWANSVVAALASALMASAAVAEHLRSDRIQKIEAQRNHESTYRNSPVALFTSRMDGEIIKTNPAWEEMLAKVPAEKRSNLDRLLGTVEASNLLTGSSDSVDMVVQIPIAGAIHWFDIRASKDAGGLIECSMQNITERVIATDRLEYLANHDALTGVLNLRGVTSTFEDAEKLPMSLAYFDLDRFKLINDMYGHSAGDNVLKQVCERFGSVVGEDDVFGRIGGDEFVVAFRTRSVDEVKQVCEEITDVIGTIPYQIDSQSFKLSSSCGLVAIDRESVSDLKQAVSAADTLCRMAKKSVTNRVLTMALGDAFFDHRKDELELIRNFERGETPEGLFLMMQPELSLSAPYNSLNFEVLVRMRRSDGKVIPAGVIIAAAEAHGRSAVIDRWVVRNVIEWLEANASQLKTTRFVGVNLSGCSLNDEMFVQELYELFDRHPAAMSVICLEITETVALTDMQNMQQFINRIRSMGGKVALDDFGAGYSSFGYLKGLSVDALKLDGTLVKDCARHPSNLAIVVALASLVESLGMKSIGEFAEDLQTIRALASAGVDYAQGYGISKPVMPEKILLATSGADFIEDPEIIEFVKSLQHEQDFGNMGSKQFELLH